MRLARTCLGLNRAAARVHFERKTLPTLTYNRLTGGVYGASTFLALLGLLDHAPHLRAGDRIGIYSYGSGSCAEFYSGTLQPGAWKAAQASGIAAALSVRRPLNIAEYEACEESLDRLIRARDYMPDDETVPRLWQQCYARQHRLVLRGLHDYRRHYEWSDQ